MSEEYFKVQCPECGAELEVFQHHVTCPRCNTEFLISLEEPYETKTFYKLDEHPKPRRRP